MDINFWEVIKGMINLSSSSIFAKWYFYSKLTSFKTITTVSSNCFGSVCFGSLLVSIITLVREFLLALKNETKTHRNLVLWIVYFIIDGFLSFFEWLLQYFNAYSFSYMAIHCEGYLKSSSKIIKLFKIKGMDALANDCIIDTSLKLYLFIVTVLGCFTSYIYTNRISPKMIDDVKLTSLLVIISGFISLQIGRSLLSIITAGVHTIFICFAEYPDGFLGHTKESKILKNPLQIYKGAGIV
ncbi:hypothetical protein DAMA08_034380 [Martiniozyma asiatica (nom. inval.)]|nr:hypothetical protein DAMA08_034380 [Martiniozyma asiatica]